MTSPASTRLRVMRKQCDVPHEIEYRFACSCPAPANDNDRDNDGGLRNWILKSLQAGLILAALALPVIALLAAAGFLPGGQ